MRLATAIEAYGTSEGATKGWDTRGRGRSKDVSNVKFYVSRSDKEDQEFVGKFRGKKVTPRTILVDMADVQHDQPTDRKLVESYRQKLERTGRMPMIRVERIADDNERVRYHFDTADGHHRYAALYKSGYRGKIPVRTFE